jgi:hypothetical protein
MTAGKGKRREQNSPGAVDLEACVRPAAMLGPAPQPDPPDTT